MIPKVFIATPVADVKEYCLYDFVEQCKNFSYPNLNILFCDNSKSSIAHKMHESGIMCEYVEPKGLAIEYIAESQNLLRQRFLESDAEYFLSLECDVFVPLDIIEYMIAQHALVYALPYFLYEEGREDGMVDTALSFQTIDNAPFQQRRMRKISQKESFHTFNGKSNNTLIPALGCTLIHRSVIEKIKFRVEPKINNMAFSDSYFFYDCKVNKIPVITDTSIIVEHRRKISQWDMLIDSHVKK